MGSCEESHFRAQGSLCLSGGSRPFFSSPVLGPHSGHLIGGLSGCWPKAVTVGPCVGLSLAGSVAAPQLSQGHGAPLTGSQRQCQATRPQLNASLSRFIPCKNEPGHVLPGDEIPGNPLPSELLRGRTLSWSPLCRYLKDIGHTAAAWTLHHLVGRKARSRPPPATDSDRPRPGLATPPLSPVL